MVKGQRKLAESIYTTHLSQRPTIMTKYIMLNARETNNHQLVEDLIDILKSQISKKEQGQIYSGLVDIYSKQKMFNESLRVLRQAKDTIGLQYIHRHCFDRVAAGLQCIGEKFPHEEFE